MQQNETLARYYSKKRKQKKRRKIAFYTVFVVLLICVITVLSLTVFFNISTIKVEGNSHYTKEQIITVSGLEKGQNLFRLNKFKIIDKLKEKLPYLDEVVIDRKLPVGIEISVTETSPFMSVETGGGYLLVDADLKILETVQVEPTALATVRGFTALTDKPGQTLTDENGLEKYLLQLTPVLSGHLGEGKVTEINIAAVYDIQIVYEERVTVKFGTLENIERKVQLVKYVLNENSPSEHAEIDVSSGERAYYKAID